MVKKIVYFVLTLTLGISLFMVFYANSPESFADSLVLEEKQIVGVLKNNLATLQSKGVISEERVLKIQSNLEKASSAVDPLSPTQLMTSLALLEDVKNSLGKVIQMDSRFPRISRDLFVVDYNIRLLRGEVDKRGHFSLKRIGR